MIPEFIIISYIYNAAELIGNSKATDRQCAIPVSKVAAF